MRKPHPTESGQPIAVVGMACRFPQAPDLPSYWRLLEEGRNAVIEGEPGSGVGRVGELFPDSGVPNSSCRFGAYLDELDLFDAPFFRISPVEAERLDPQQRMMLEVSWQALEDAGMDPEGLKGSRTGVYAGISNYDYRNLILGTGETSEPAASLYTVTGTSFNTAIGRVAYVLGLEGPAMALDTACSSSLVAMHQAVTGLQRGDADLALAGGVHAIFSGRLLELRANAGMLSPDGRCATFDAGANGYVRGEGCGIVVLKRLEEAEADGDRIWAVIRGSAVNQDGASPGLTVPNGASQEKVIEQALARAGVQPSEVDYVEAHGTGTEVGDPIEALALAAAYGREREADRPLLVGSVKTNIGHLEPAAGAAGLMKTVLAMQHGMIPKQLHFQTPNPELDWDRLPLQVTSEPTEWPLRPGRARLAGVSGFGWSGTNAHVVVEGYDGRKDAEPGPSPTGSPRQVTVTLPAPIPDHTTEPRGIGPRETRFLPLSGKSPAALRALANRYVEWLDGHAEDLSTGDASDPLLADMAWTAGVGRSHFQHRAGVVFRDAGSLRDGLGELTEADTGPGSDDGEIAAGKVAFLYTGQASQWVGMGAELYESEPIVRAVLDHCDALLRESGNGSLLDAMFGRSAGTGRSAESVLPPDLDDPVWKQPAIYALECALTAQWASIGIRPDVVLGHSLGEIAAAQAAEVYSLEDGLRFAAIRGALMAALPGEGAMAAIFAPADRVAAAVADHNETIAGVGISVAADNGAHQVVSGPADQVEAILSRFEREDFRVRLLRKSPAYHSAMMDPVLDDLGEAVSGIRTQPPLTPYISSMTGSLVGEGQELDGAYWRRQTREPVAFRKAIATLADLGIGTVIEVGPHAVLGPMVSMAWPDAPDSGGPPAVLASLLRPSREAPEEARGAFTVATARAYELGLPVALSKLFCGEERRRISVPGYPFQRERQWIGAARRQRPSVGHPLLGTRHESASGEVAFDTELFPSDPSWLNDHRVFGRFVVPGALFGSMTAAAASEEGIEVPVIEDLQLHSPLILPEEDDSDSTMAAGVRVQILLDAPSDEPARRVRILSKRSDEDEWKLHTEARVSATNGEATPNQDVAGLKASLALEDVSALYRAKAEVGIEFGPSFRTLQAAWSGEGEALAEVVLPAGIDQSGIDPHPLLLDGCFQVMATARESTGADKGSTYLPFGWERLRLAGQWPERVFCHVRMRHRTSDQDPEVESGGTSEVFTADMTICDTEGTPLGELTGYTVKRATQATLITDTEGLDELLYDIVWREQALLPGMPPADFLRTPSDVEDNSPIFATYLAAEGVEPHENTNLQNDLEQLAWSSALSNLERLGWERTAGSRIEAESLRRQLGVLDEHRHLFQRMLNLLSDSGVLKKTDDGFIVAVGSGDPLPEGLSADPAERAARLTTLHPHGASEIALFRRCAGALPEVLRGQEDPLSLLFGDEEPRAGDLYMKAPVWKAANLMMGDVVEMIVAGLPEGRRLKVIEVGAGVGSATACILPKLRPGSYDYTYTDISAGFFAEAQSRFSDEADAIEYRVLDIEKDPIAQGFDLHGYDVVIAANVLHATQYLNETLDHCRRLLAPSGQLIALENQRKRGWMDLIFGQLDGWWRFADRYRPNHALAGPDVWRQALLDVGMAEAEVVGVDRTEETGLPDRGVIVASGPAEVILPGGVWVVAADRGGLGESVAMELAAQNQTVVLAGEDFVSGGDASGGDASGGDAPDGTIRDEESSGDGLGVVRRTVERDSRESWSAFFSDLPGDPPLAGIVHLEALDGHGPGATTPEMAEDLRHGLASALALVQGAADADATPSGGTWFVTRGGQILERERGGQLAGAALWGFGRVLAREAGDMRPRMIDLDPDAAQPADDLVQELLFPDHQTDIARRGDRRLVARLVRAEDGVERLSLPEDADWKLVQDEAGALEELHAEPRQAHPLEPGEVRVSVDVCGLNFLDVFRAIGLVPGGHLGSEFCGRIREVGSEVTTVAPGDRVVGLAFGAMGAEAVTLEELVAPAPPKLPTAALATMPEVFVTAALSFELTGLETGDRVLVHAGAGGVGLAAIQLAQAAGAEVFATASAPKRAYLRSLGVKHVFDSRQTAFGEEILEVTGGTGVDVVVNSLTGEGFIEASLSCLAQGGRFVELARRDILSPEEMAETRPDVAYSILELDVLKTQDPARPGAALRQVMRRLEAGELKPLIHAVWPMSETRSAMAFMRGARHIGKIILAAPPLRAGGLRQDRTYLVTGGLGGIGCAVAQWLADHGARTIVLNGRRDPDPEAGETISALQNRGVTVQVELADLTDPAAVDAMFERIGSELPPLAGVIHSVGVLADGAVGNQSWERFESVVRPKALGAWHLHRATEHLDLDMFVLFSSVAGVLGNPGQSNHASANAFLDQLAAHRRALGLPGQAIAWGAWSEIGEAEEQRERIAQRVEATGIEWITPQQGLLAFERLLREDGATGVVLARDWSVFDQPGDGRPPLLSEILSALDTDSDDTPGLSEELLPRLRETPAAEREDLILSFLQEEVQAVLSLPTTPASNVGFFDLGMDSLMAVEFRNRVNRALAGSYTAPNTLVFDYPDISSLVAHLVDEIGDAELDSDGLETGDGAGSETATDPVAPTESGSEAAADPVATTGPGSGTVPRTDNEGIAIIGMACRFPGASDLNTFWSMLENGADAVTDARPDAGSGIVPSNESDQGDEGWRRGGFIDGIDRFDARFFRVSPLEARSMDPQQRMLLETSWHALDDAGIDPDRLRGSRTGVYTGISSSDYRDLMMDRRDSVDYLGTNRSLAVSRVSFLLGLEGPAIPLELNCASALFAVHQAVAGLRLGEVDMALAGGVNTVLSPDLTAGMAYLGMLSHEGRCSAFDARADGFVRGEGCGVLVLKRLSAAQAAGDRIWGVIRGSAVNQNGATAGPTVPNGPAQERVIEDALTQAGVDPAEVDYLEAHGAGSALGDPIEVQAAAAVYGRGRASDRPLLIGSVKTNIGHLESAAGLAGLIKAVMAMHRQRIPKQLHFEKPNPNVDWDRLPVRVVSEAADWPTYPDRPHRAAVSAFGVSGANAHVVVESYGTCADGAQSAETGFRVTGTRQTVAVKLPAGVPEPQWEDLRPRTRANRLLPLSGKNPAALMELSGNYLSWLDRCLATGSNEESEEEFLADMAWTASIGRSHFNCRSGVVFRDIATLRQGLEELASNEAPSASVETNWINVAAARRKAAFVYDGWDGRWRDIAKGLYDTEPVVRGFLDHCEALFRNETDTSLLDPLFDGDGTEKPVNGPAWTDPAAYSLQCAVTALWSSLDVRPGVVCGRGVGEIAAAQTAGAFTLDEGLRIALARGETVRAMDENRSEEVPVEAALARLDGINVSTPSLAIVSGATGNEVGAADVLDLDRWLHQTLVGHVASAAARNMAGLAVDTLIEIGPGSEFAVDLTEAWPEVPAGVAAAAPALLGSLSRSSDGADEEEGDGFLQAAKTAYDIGLPISPEGLFAGESRRRRSLPGYPFQRRRFWIG